MPHLKVILNVDKHLILVVFSDGTSTAVYLRSDDWIKYFVDDLCLKFKRIDRAFLFWSKIFTIRNLNDVFSAARFV